MKNSTVLFVNLKKKTCYVDLKNTTKQNKKKKNLSYKFIYYNFRYSDIKIVALSLFKAQLRSNFNPFQQ